MLLPVNILFITLRKYNENSCQMFNILSHFDKEDKNVTILKPKSLGGLRMYVSYLYLYYIALGNEFNLLGIHPVVYNGINHRISHRQPIESKVHVLYVLHV